MPDSPNPAQPPDPAALVERASAETERREAVEQELAETRRVVAAMEQFKHRVEELEAAGAPDALVEQLKAAANDCRSGDYGPLFRKAAAALLAETERRRRLRHILENITALCNEALSLASLDTPEPR